MSLHSKSTQISPVIAATKAALFRGSDSDARTALKDASPADWAYGNLLRFQFLRRSGKQAEAIAALNAAECIDSPELTPPDVFQELVSLYLRDKDLSAAQEVLRRGLAALPADTGLRLRECQLDCLGESPLVAAEKLKSILERDTITSKINSFLVAALKEVCSKLPEVGEPLLNLALEKRPKSGDIIRLIAGLQFDRGDFANAAKSFKRALPLVSGHARTNVEQQLIVSLKKDGVNPDEIDAHIASDTSTAGGHDSFRVCAITMVYNEKFNLPVWLGHYGRQVGIENCIILDNGTDDGSTADLKGAGKILLPRGRTYNERHRMALINGLANNLLNYYDAVIYTDCDEMLVAEPDKYQSLTEYCRRMTAPVIHAIGLNVRHDISSESALRLDAPLLQQRRLVQFVSPMCKPLIIKKPITWGGGFHSCDKPVNFNDIYLFHLRHADLDQALARLAVTKTIEFAREGGGRHHRRDEEELRERMYERVKGIPAKEGFDFSEATVKHKANIQISHTGMYHVAKATTPRHLFVIPERFKNIF